MSGEINFRYFRFILKTPSGQGDILLADLQVQVRYDTAVIGIPGLAYLADLIP